MAAGPEASATRLPADLAQRRVAMLNLRITLISKSPDNAGYSKRALALDQVETMKALGFERFAFAGHDRGAHRRRDHLERGERVALLDIVPTLYRFETIDQKAAMSSWRWFFLIQPTQTSAEPATRQTMPALFCCFGIERIRCYSIVQGFKFR